MASTDGTGPAGLLLRPAGPEDAPVLAELHLRVRAASVPLLPPPVHGLPETVAWMAARLSGTHEAWLAEVDGVPTAYAAFTSEGSPWLDDLYVDAAHAGAGIGSALLDLVKARLPDGFELWVFTSNLPARRFYRRHGLVELEQTDGAANEERSPDLRMAWPGSDPLAFFRRRIDEVDDDLAPLVAQRVALTAAVQGFKARPGHAGRDPVRELEIARHLAARAPGLAVEDWSRVLDALIGVGLHVGRR